MGTKSLPGQGHRLSWRGAGVRESHYCIPCFAWDRLETRRVKVNSTRLLLKIRVNIPIEGSIYLAGWWHTTWLSRCVTTTPDRFIISHNALPWRSPTEGRLSGQRAGSSRAMVLSCRPSRCNVSMVCSMISLAVWKGRIMIWHKIHDYS